MIFLTLIMLEKYNIKWPAYSSPAKYIGLSLNSLWIAINSYKNDMK